MKCKHCNNDIKGTMNYCPYCSKALKEEQEMVISTAPIVNMHPTVEEMQNSAKKNKRKNLIISCVLILVIVVAIVIYQVISLKQSEKEKENQLADMVSSICSGEYDTVYAPNEYKNQGIYQCENDKYVYYVNDTQRICGLYTCGEIYEIGYPYHEEIEKVFPNAIYLYRQSRVTTVPSELKIAVEVGTEDELIYKYAEDFYQLIKNMNSQYKEELLLNVYYNSSLSGINNTYDRLFLMAGFYSNNVTQSYGMGRGYGEYIFYDGDPMNLFNNIFASLDNYPTNARNALKFNRHISMKINDGKTITFDDFLERFKTSFEDTL